VAMFKYGQPQPYQDNADFALMQNTVNHIKKVLY
jgi:predicted phage gp36 major capsid-like protein